VRSYKYLIVGGGMTGDSAVRGIRDHDKDGSIGLVGAESHPPYSRPPLSKALWQGKDESSVWRGTEELGVDLVLGRRVVSLDLDGHRATDHMDEEYEFEKLLLATGGIPRMLDDAPADTIYFRTLDDFRKLHEQNGDGQNILVVGGGFIGSEIAAAVQSNGSETTMVFPENGVCARLFPAELSGFVTDYYREKGVVVHTGQLATPELLRSARVVVAGLGIVPNTELAESVGLQVDNGIVVDEYGRAGRDDVFAAGDVARFPVAALGTTMRVEHEDHANTHGRTVGANMAGANTPYDHLPFFYSDLFDLGYEAVGEIDSRHDTVEHWKEPGREGVVAYVDGDGRPRGFLLWNVWGKVDDARELIKKSEPIDGSAVEALAG
jgi:3-phenylpropionate/trans-cinnamate dioxygenase ferredoxin reductase component